MLKVLLFSARLEIPNCGGLLNNKSSCDNNMSLYTDETNVEHIYIRHHKQDSTSMVFIWYSSIILDGCSDVASCV